MTPFQCASVQVESFFPAAHPVTVAIAAPPAAALRFPSPHHGSRDSNLTFWLALSRGYRAPFQNVRLDDHTSVLRVPIEPCDPLRGAAARKRAQGLRAHRGVERSNPS